MMKHGLIIALSLSLSCLSLHAQKDKMDFGLETRVSYSVPGSFGFDYCALYAKGDLGDKFSYYMYGYPNKISTSASFFDALSWGMLTYAPAEHFTIEFGKQMIEYAGTEYDYKPIDVFAPAEYWNNYPAFQLGLTGQYLNDSGDIFSVQISQSPFRKYSTGKEFYAYSVSARGSRDVFGYSASFNALEYSDNAYVGHEVLSGWAFLGPVKLELDLINRSELSRFELFKDYTMVSQAILDLGNGVKVFGKFSKDRNASDAQFDYMVRQGADLTGLTAGLLWYPESAGGNVRLHVYYSSVRGTQPSLSGALKPDTSLLNLGATWNISFIHR